MCGYWKEIKVMFLWNIVLILFSIGIGFFFDVGLVVSFDKYYSKWGMGGYNFKMYIYFVLGLYINVGVKVILKCVFW